MCLSIHLQVVVTSHVTSLINSASLCGDVTVQKLFFGYGPTGLALKQLF